MDQRRTFSREFKLAAVKKVIEQGISYAQVARDLDVRDNLIRNWKKAFQKDGTLKFVDRPLSAACVKQAQVTEAIEGIHAQKHHDAYGSPRVHQELLRRGITCCRNTVVKYMSMAGISANRRTKFRISTTDSRHNHPIAPNLLNQTFAAKSINEVWLTDITYIPSQEGFNYLAAIVPARSLAGKRVEPLTRSLLLRRSAKRLPFEAPALV